MALCAGEPLVVVPYLHLPLINATLHIAFKLPSGRNPQDHHIFPRLAAPPPLGTKQVRGSFHTGRSMLSLQVAAACLHVHPEPTQPLLEPAYRGRKRSVIACLPSSKPTHLPPALHARCNECPHCLSEYLNILLKECLDSFPLCFGPLFTMLSLALS